jgi:hypothetical protein
VGRVTAPTITVPMPAGSPDLRRQARERMSRPDFSRWLEHVRPAAACTRPIRLVGDLLTVEADTGRLLSRMHTNSLPDRAIYKACGNRREAVCPSCSARYKRDAYQLVRAGLIGGKGVPEHVATHPAVFPTFTAPSFGPVHGRRVAKHQCTNRRRCDCRAEPCHPRTGQAAQDRCPHGRSLVCFARHEDADQVVGSGLCRDCYDHDAQVVWNLNAPELWRRTSENIRKYLRRLAKARGVDPKTVRLEFGKAAEMQRRAAVHYHAIIRLDGRDPNNRAVILSPPPGFDAQDLVDAVEHAARVTSFTTDPHPAKPEGWHIAWGDQVLTRVIRMAGDGDITDGMVAAYIAKYATKSTEATGQVLRRLSGHTVRLFADPDGSHTERLVEACWTLGGPRWPVEGPACARVCRHRSCWQVAQAPAWRPTLAGPVCPRDCPHRSCAEIRVATSDPAAPWRGLRRWAHMFGFGGHFFTKSRAYSVTFTILRQQRVVFRRTELAGPQPDEPAAEQPTTLVVNFLQFVGAGWHTTADAMLANTSAALAREHEREAQQQMAALAA